MESVTDATGTPSTRSSHPFGQDSAGIPESPHRIVAELNDLDRAFSEALELQYGTDTESASRAARLSMVCARRAGWWGLLARWAYREQAVPPVLGRAALIARQSNRDDARFWRESADDWRARAERRPTSDAAGALSNWHELGVGA